MRRSLALLVILTSAMVALFATSGAASAPAVCTSPPPATIQAEPGVVTSGTPGPDVIYGTPGPDRIAGLGGDDVIVGFGGDDQLSGGDGNDTLCGGAGNDELAAGEGNDVLSGDAGADRLSAGGGVDSCHTDGDTAAPASCESVVTTTTSTSSTTTTTTTVTGAVRTPAIFLGYADTLHEDVRPIVPDPWRGDPGVTFLGCRDKTEECGGSYDAGAVRIDNPATNPTLTLVDAYVDIGPCRYQPWGQFFPATVGPGGTLILTQTGMLGLPQPAPCNASMNPSLRPILNFATSYGPFDTYDPNAHPPYFINCDPNRVPAPVIVLTFSNGMTLTVTDADEVLSTGGVNRWACTGLTAGAPWTPVPAANVVRAGG